MFQPRSTCFNLGQFVSTYFNLFELTSMYFNFQKNNNTVICHFLHDPTLSILSLPLSILSLPLTTTKPFFYLCLPRVLNRRPLDFHWIHVLMSYPLSHNDLHTNSPTFDKHILQVPHTFTHIMQISSRTQCSSVSQTWQLPMCLKAV